MKRNLFIVLIFVALLVAIPWSKAAEFSITCDHSGCSNGGQKLFDGAIAAPGESVMRSLEIVNNDDEQINVNVKAVKNSGTDEDFLQYVTLAVRNDANQLLFWGNMNDFFSQTVDLGGIPAGKVKDFGFTMTLADVPNEYQGKKINFDFPVNLNVPGDGGGGGGANGTGGAGGGAAASPSPSSSLTQFTSTSGLVAGLQTGSEESPEPSVTLTSVPAEGEEILGEETVRSNWYWWLLLLLIPLLIWLIKRRRRKNVQSSL